MISKQTLLNSTTKYQKNYHQAIIYNSNIFSIKSINRYIYTLKEKTVRN